MERALIICVADRSMEFARVPFTAIVHPPIEEVFGTEMVTPLLEVFGEASSEESCCGEGNTEDRRDRNDC